MWFMQNSDRVPPMTSLTKTFVISITDQTKDTTYIYLINNKITNLLVKTAPGLATKKILTVRSGFCIDIG